MYVPQAMARRASPVKVENHDPHMAPAVGLPLPNLTRSAFPGVSPRHSPCLHYNINLSVIHDPGRRTQAPWCDGVTSVSVHPHGGCAASSRLRSPCSIDLRQQSPIPLVASTMTILVATMLETKFAQFAKLQPPPRIILGSASSSRRQIMDEMVKQFGFSYIVRTADIDEKAIRRPKPEELVMDLAHAKADAIKEKMRQSGEEMSGYLVTCDQVGGDSQLSVLCAHGTCSARCTQGSYAAG